MTNAREVEINARVELFGGNANGSFLIHTGQGRRYLDDGFLEEILFHEAAHVSLDAKHANAPGWSTAQAADGVFVSTYARDNPAREDVAESILPYFAVPRPFARLGDADRTAISRSDSDSAILLRPAGFRELARLMRHIVRTKASKPALADISAAIERLGTATAIKVISEATRRRRRRIDARGSQAPRVLPAVQDRPRAPGGGLRRQPPAAEAEGARRRQCTFDCVPEPRPHHWAAADMKGGHS